MGFYSILEVDFDADIRLRFSDFLHREKQEKKNFVFCESNTWRHAVFIPIADILLTKIILFFVSTFLSVDQKVF